MAAESQTNGKIINPSWLDKPAFLMNVPFSLAADVANNAWMEEIEENKRHIDIRKAINQFLQLYHFMAADSVVYLLPTPNVTGLQDLVYCANMGVVLEHTPDCNSVVLSNFTTEVRRPETKVGNEFFHAMGYDVYTALGYSIDDAYNMIVKRAIDVEAEWLLIIEDDVLLPPDAFVKIANYMDRAQYPVVSGLYYLKAEPTEPLLFRGRGSGAFHDFELGDLVMVDGVPMGCLLIHMSILKWFYDNEDTPVYNTIDGMQVKKVVETPRRLFYDVEKGYSREEGTQDLYLCDRIIENKVLEKTGWNEAAGEKYPFLVDTSLFCQHIDRNTGKQYPGHNFSKLSELE